MPSVDFNQVAEVFMRPELLQHPQIPAALAGVSPRIIMGQDWWDVQRRIVYAKNSGHCWACGEEGRLEAHEVYEVDYKLGRMVFIEIVALCGLCHSFVHIGRTTRLMEEKKITKEAWKQILKHSLAVLKGAGLKAHWGLGIVLRFLPTSMSVKDVLWLTRVRLKRIEPIPPRPIPVPWRSWRMVFQDKEYPPRFLGPTESRNYYMTEE